MALLKTTCWSKYWMMSYGLWAVHYVLVRTHRICWHFCAWLTLKGLLYIAIKHCGLWFIIWMVGRIVFNMQTDCVLLNITGETMGFAPFLLCCQSLKVFCETGGSAHFLVVTDSWRMLTVLHWGGKVMQAYLVFTGERNWVWGWGMVSWYDCCDPLHSDK